MNDPKILDRAEGALIGSALGDTIGIYTEFMTAEQARAAYGGASPNFTLVPPETPLYNDHHRCRFQSRAWTDDTDHTILMVLSYLRLRKLSQDDFAVRLHSWCTQGLRVLDREPMGLGKTVGSVVSFPDFEYDPPGTALYIWEQGGRRIAANGSLMRTTPVGVIGIPKTEEETFAAAILMGAVTHADPRCAVSVAIVSALIRALCKGDIQEEHQLRSVIERAWDYVVRTQSGRPLDRAEFDRHVYTETLDSLVLGDKSMGYVYKCLGSALWCLRQVLSRKETFHSAMTTLVMYGGDADTNGAVAGALMGALCGYKLLPTEWRDGMRYQEWYHAKIAALCSVTGLSDEVYDSASDVDTELDGGKGFISEEEIKRRETAVIAKVYLADMERRRENSDAEVVTRAESNSAAWKALISDALAD
ncbi:ADP-ribosylglycohydrolase-domain-containing protein [Mycena rebaudengoi]|nr:ADP-ribosylglycohydrolase-domain-containing protein [Mycena rebaudengoi]